MTLRLALLASILASGCGPAALHGLPQDSDAAAPPAQNEPQAESKPEANEDEEKPQGHVTVRCVPAERRAFAVTVDGLGRTEALPGGIGALTAPVEGHVEKLLVELGQNVKAGQPIVQLNTTVIRSTLAEKRAARDSLVASLALLESLPRPEERRSAELAVDQAKVGVDRAQSVVERLRPLLPKQEVSPQQLFDAEQLLKQAELQKKTAEAQLALMQLGPRAEAVAEARTKITTAEQTVLMTQALLDLHTLRAPISGTVEALTCHPGQTLTIGATLGEVVDTSKIFATVYFPMRAAERIRVGLKAEIDATFAEPGEAVSYAGQAGEVAFVGRVADPTTGNVPVRVLVENPSAELRLGQVIKATISVRKEQPAIAVPETALFDQGEGSLLAVVRDGKLQILHPEPGLSQAGWVAVAKTDLQEGEMVVTEGAYNVPEGTEATIVQAPRDKPERPGESKAAGQATGSGPGRVGADRTPPGPHGAVENAQSAEGSPR
jgi:RND family efflux transporter MFP subunit